MEQNKSTLGWKTWLKLNRIVPLLTILVAGGAGVLSILNVVQATPVEGIIIALLALISIDALTERLSILEKIETHLRGYSIGVQLRTRTQLLHPHELAGMASEIAFIGVSGITVIQNYLGFFEDRMKEGCRLRFVLLDPDSPSLQTWNLLTKVTTTETDIKTALELLKGLMQERVRGKCEVRLSKVYVPFAMLISDPHKDTGLMNVEFYTYKTMLSDRPHMKLSRNENQFWFDFYTSQFEQVWSDSEKWAGLPNSERTLNKPSA